MFVATKAQTRKPFGANFVIGFPIEERLARALEHGVPIISFFWGDASTHLARVKASGALAMQVVGSVTRRSEPRMQASTLSSHKAARRVDTCAVSWAR